VDRDDVGVLQPRGGLRLFTEPAPELVIVEKIGRQYLHGYLAVEGGLDSPVDDGHTSPADALHELIGTEALALELANTAPVQRRCHGRSPGRPAPMEYRRSGGL